MGEDVMGNVTIGVILAIVAIAIIISTMAQSDIKKAFKTFCDTNGLSYLKNLVKLDLPGMNAAWFLNIPGAYNTRIHDVCDGIYEGHKLTLLKYQYSEGHANYLSVFIFSLDCPDIPHTFLWTKKTAADLKKKTQKWSSRELDSNRLLCSEDLNGLPDKFYQCLVLLAKEPGLDQTRIEFLDPHIIFIPHDNFQSPDNSFITYLSLLVASVKQIKDSCTT